jgi:hypothetical protein
MGNDITVSPKALKAAMLFIWKDENWPACRLPWAQRLMNTNVLAAFDGHTMIVINDKDGRHYPRKPRQVGGKPFAGGMPDWWKVMQQLTKPKAKAGQPIEIFTGYNNRILRAAFVLGVEAVHITTRGLTDPVTYHLGANAYALVIPRRGASVSALPDWLERVAAKHA